MVDAKTGAVSASSAGSVARSRWIRRINGAEIPLIFDTGASAVVLTRGDATQGLASISGHLVYDTAVQTANGMGRAASVELGRDRHRRYRAKNIRAYVTEDGALDTSLLGMTFLETLTRYAVGKVTRSSSPTESALARSALSAKVGHRWRIQCHSAPMTKTCCRRSFAIADAGPHGE